MKFTNYFFLAMVGIALLTTSCGGDDDSVVGTWNLKTETYTDCNDPDENLTEVYSTTLCTDDSPSDCQSTQVTFTETTYATTIAEVYGTDFNTYSFEGNYTKDGNTVTICILAECETATFSRNGDELIFTTGPDEDGCNLRQVYEKG